MQKPIKPSTAKKKQQVANRHGKIARTKRGWSKMAAIQPLPPDRLLLSFSTTFLCLVCISGRLERAPKRPKVKTQHEEDAELTKAINQENEMRFAGVAANTGGKLAVLRPPPVVATAHDKKRMPTSSKAGTPWGAASSKR
jgi:hypothetical protein